ncbi:hypothetical protein [Niabella ginsengisoli]|uniref:Uncharacterized protein n=1 Tax=Niabella ginsengisoli TaxID=522298 RepID=A0ABS9SP67_9BACT|nr:hypothetical protein [Niabella ginsengisoli]MCH5600152.1 hypothetical protein [Niabella ginsengisoli]
MKTIYILAPEHAVMQAVADPQYCFNTVNEFLQVSGRDALSMYKWWVQKEKCDSAGISLL